MDQLEALPGNFLEFGLFAVIAAVAGYGAYLLCENGLRNGFTPLSIGAGVVSAGAAITAGVFAVIAFWAMLAGLAVLGVLAFLAWAIFNN